MSAHSAFENALPAWRRMLTAEQVLNEHQAQERYGADTSGAKRDIAGALRPLSEEQVQHCVQVAHAQGVGLHPISTGNNWGYGTALPPRDGLVILDMSGMQRIIDFDAELGVVTVEPGVTQGMLHEFLVRGGHNFMVPTTGAGPDCSLMGNALQRGYGITPIADHWAAVTDLKALRPDGSWWQSKLAQHGGEGLARLYKWGLGPYEHGLFTQNPAMSAGVVTQMSIVLARRPAVVQMGMFGLRSDALLEEAVLRVRGILQTLPGVVGGINLMNQLRVLAMTAPYPADLCGPDGVLPQAVVERLGREQQVMPWTGVVTLYGTEAVTAAARAEVRRQLRGVGSRLMFFTPKRARMVHRVASALPSDWLGGRVRKLVRSAQALSGALELAGGIPNRTAMPLAYWRHPRGLAATPGGLQADPARDGCGLLWFAPLVPMRPSLVRAQVQLVCDVTHEHGLEPLITFTSISERLFDSTVPLLFDRGDDVQSQSAESAYRALVKAGMRHGTYPYRIPIGMS